MSPQQREVVEMLEALVERAKAQEVTSFCAVVSGPEGHTSTSYWYPSEEGALVLRTAMLASCDILDYRICGGCGSYHTGLLCEQCVVVET